MLVGRLIWVAVRLEPPDRRHAELHAGRFGPARRGAAVLGEPEPSAGVSCKTFSLPYIAAENRISNDSLPADHFELLGYGNPRWAGNLNTFVETRAAERHLARAVRIHTGEANLADIHGWFEARRPVISIE
jgi:hypothetical protein